MSTFAELSTDQQAQVTAFVDQLFRPIEGQTARAFSQVAHMLDVANSGVLALLQQLDAGTVLPSTSGLAGAQPLTSDSVVSSIGTYLGAAATFNSDAMRQSRIKSAGIANTAP